LYLVTSIFFVIFGGRFYYRFSTWGNSYGPLLLETKNSVLPRVKMLTMLGSGIFSVRGVICIWSAYGNWPADWWIDISYYFCLEIIPLTLLLLALMPAKNPSPEIKGVSINNHLINNAPSNHSSSSYETNKVVVQSSRNILV